MPINAISMLIPGGRYKIDYSGRFDHARTPYMTRAQVAGNKQTWTYSAWVKAIDHGLTGSTKHQLTLLCGGDTAGSAYERIVITVSDSMRLGYANGGAAVSCRSLKDPTGWYHLVVQKDTTLGASNNVKMWVNGVLQSITVDYAWPSGTSYAYVNDAGFNLQISRFYSGEHRPHNGYMADVYLIDGQALTASHFGETRGGVWAPKKYAGTFGGNSHFLEFKDPSQMGKDTSGNGKNFTVSGLLSTDQSLDTPTTNFCTINTLDKNNTYGTLSFEQGALRGVNSNDDWANCTQWVNSGKWYWEWKIVSGIGLYPGICRNPASPYLMNGWAYNHAGNKYQWSNGAGGNLGAYGATFGAGDVIGVALDLDAGTLTFYKNGVSQGVAASGLTGYWTPWIYTASTSTVDLNFGQFAFTHTPPALHKKLCSDNLLPPFVGSGSFQGTADARGPNVWCGGTPATVIINGNVVIWDTHAIKTATGFKVITSSASYNASGTNNWTATLGAKFATAETVNTAQ